MYNIKITEPAKEDIKSVIYYISVDLRNPVAAQNMLNFIETEIKSLSEMPFRHPLVEDAVLAQNGFRLIQVKNYLVFYTVREKSNSVIIQRVLYSRRDWLNILK